ncbi:hypothetical protein JTB14_025852 [Gonioctena quinquepunctata]|nr:hypothetical protein JTB14_025852 [Gonioctena quinquepunctata]
MNPIIFSDSDFAPAFVTDRPELQPEPEATYDGNNVDVVPEIKQGHNVGNSSEEADEMYLDSIRTTSKEYNIKVMKIFSPEVVRPFPKIVRPLPYVALPLTTNNRGKKRRQAAILTNTLEMNALEDEESLRKKKTDIVAIKKGK